MQKIEIKNIQINELFHLAVHDRPTELKCGDGQGPPAAAPVVH